MEKGYLFRGKAVSFEEAFPEIDEISVTGTEGDMAQKNNISLNKKSLDIHCSNPLCENKGYVTQLGDFISEMYQDKEISKDKLISCGGYEKMGRGQTRRCLNHLNINVKIKYKTPSKRQEEKN